MARAQTPSEALKVQDIALYSAKFEQPIEFELGRHANRYRVQGNHRIRAETADVVDIEQTEAKALRVFVDLSVEAILNDDFELPEGNDDQRTLFRLNAEFLLSFRIDVDLDRNPLLDFVRVSCPMLVWPFWRQHVFDTLKRASLPMVAVPLLGAQNLLLNPRLVESAVQEQEKPPA